MCFAHIRSPSSSPPPTSRPVAPLLLQSCQMGLLTVCFDCSEKNNLKRREKKKNRKPTEEATV